MLGKGKGPKVCIATAQAVGAGQRHCRGELERLARDTTLLLDVTRPLRAEPPQEVLRGGKPCSILLAKQRKKGQREDGHTTGVTRSASQP